MQAGFVFPKDTIFKTHKPQNWHLSSSGTPNFVGQECQSLEFIRQMAVLPDIQRTEYDGVAGIFTGQETGEGWKRCAESVKITSKSSADK